jgi:hypothetical protein
LTHLYYSTKTPWCLPLVSSFIFLCPQTKIVGFFSSQSEPIPTNAPIGHYVHRIGYVSSSSSWPYINSTLYHNQPFDPFLFFGCFFFSTLTILPSHLVTLIPYLPYWPSYIIHIHFSFTYQPLTYLPFIFSWLSLFLG